MDRIRDFLCPHLQHGKIRKRCKVIRHQIARPVESDLVAQVPQIQKRICEVCKNKNEGNVVHDKAQGIRICLGPDGMGCGAVLSENMFQNDRCDLILTPEMYSDQHASTCGKIAHRNYQKLNRMIEKNLSRYGKEDTVTSDMYKDEQRSRIYDLIDRVQRVCDIDPVVCDEVKVFFHNFRERMYRIHDVNMLICCLFYMVMNKK